MALISDILLIAGALGAAFYCIILSRKLSKLGNLESGMGRAISALSTQVTDLTKTIDKANATAKASADNLIEITKRAEDVAKRSEEVTRQSADVTKRAEDTSRMLELQMAAMHDLPVATPPTEPEKFGPFADARTESHPDEFAGPVADLSQKKSSVAGSKGSTTAALEVAQ